MTATEVEDRESPLRVVLTVPDRDTLMRMMETLDEGNVQIHTEDIISLGGSEPRQVTIDLTALTEKQRRTVEIALETGYYEQPRNADLTDLAEEIEISKSAVSQRLRAAETKIIKNAFGKY